MDKVPTCLLACLPTYLPALWWWHVTWTINTTLVTELWLSSAVSTPTPYLLVFEVKWIFAIFLNLLWWLVINKVGFLYRGSGRMPLDVDWIHRMRLFASIRIGGSTLGVCPFHHIIDKLEMKTQRDGKCQNDCWHFFDDIANLPKPRARDMSTCNIQGAKCRTTLLRLCTGKRKKCTSR